MWPLLKWLIYELYIYQVFGEDIYFQRDTMHIASFSFIMILHMHMHEQNM